MCILLCTVVIHNTAQNSTYPPDNHQCSDEPQTQDATTIIRPTSSCACPKMKLSCLHGWTKLDFINEARHDEWQWHQLDHMQIIGISLQTDKRVRTSSLNFLQSGCSSWCLTNSVKALKATNITHRIGEIIIRYLPTTYNASMVGRATERNSQHGRTLFAVVRHCTIFTNSTNCYCIHRVGITIVVAVVTDDATVSAGNNINGSVSMATKLDTMPHAFDCDVLRSIDCFTVVLRAPATTITNNTSVATLNNNHYVPYKTRQSQTADFSHVVQLAAIVCDDSQCGATWGIRHYF